MADGRYVRESGDVGLKAAATVSGFECWQLPDGRAAFQRLSSAVSSAERVSFDTDGQYTMPKATGYVALAGGRAYWDHSANNVSFRKVNDRDFYVGRFVEDADSGDTSCVVNLNLDLKYDIDLFRDPVLSALAGTPVAGAFGYPVRLGGCAILEMSSVSEAQKVDLMSVDGFATGANAIVEGAFRVISDGASTTVDVSLGVANGTDATNADSITESIFVHLDENSLVIYAESDDGTTEIPATSTTINYAEGSAVAQRVEFWMDMRNPADVQIYINGVLALPSTVFNVNVAVGPWFLLAHVEKTSSSSIYKLAVDWLRARYCEQQVEG